MKVSDIRKYLAEQNISCDVRGETDFEINRFCVPQNIENNTMIWVKNKENIDWEAVNAHKNVLLVTADDVSPQDGITALIVPHSKAVFFGILDRFFAQKKVAQIAKTARVLSNSIGKNVSIGENAFIDENVIIGDNVIIGNNVSIENTVIIGDNTIIFSGTVIGSAGFGFYKDETGNNMRVPHYGRVIIGHDVEIGANCVVNRGTLGDTVIGDYTKIDSLNYISHNVIIGKNCLITTGVIIGGSSQIGDDSYLALGACIKNQVKVGKNSMVNMGTVLTDDLPDNTIQGKRRIKMDYKMILNL